jgi:RNA 2',3'-cyclic 3'-phosphodiesterase
MVRWLSPDSLHITLKFIGQVVDNNVSKIQRVLTICASEVAPFSLSTAGSGVFPSSRRPSVFWLGLTGGVEPLQALAGALDAGLKEVGIATEPRPYRAHVTLGRLASDRKGYPALATDFTRHFADFPNLSFPVRSFQLVQSHLESTGSRYEILTDYPLTGPAA